MTRLTLTGAAVLTLCAGAAVAAPDATFEKSAQQSVGSESPFRKALLTQHEISAQDGAMIQVEFDRPHGHEGDHGRPNGDWERQRERERDRDRERHDRERHGGWHQPHEFPHGQWGRFPHGDRHWGYGRNWWYWNAAGIPVWYGWVIWQPYRGECRPYYNRLQNNCISDANITNAERVALCEGNYFCMVQSNEVRQMAVRQCEADHAYNVQRFCSR